MAYRRAGKGSDTVWWLRREGKLPAVLYGYRTEETLAVDAQALRAILESEAIENTLIDLFINDDPPRRCRVRLWAVQDDAVSLALVHVDFDRVSSNRTGRGDATQTASESRHFPLPESRGKCPGTG
jgi:ribosomal protein L25 (general stress protein Ctc)